MIKYSQTKYKEQSKPAKCNIRFLPVVKPNHLRVGEGLYDKHICGHHYADEDGESFKILKGVKHIELFVWGKYSDEDEFCGSDIVCTEKYQCERY